MTKNNMKNNENNINKKDVNTKKEPKEKPEPKPLETPSRAIPTRINILFFLIFALFLILIARLYSMQIINHDFYERKLEESGSVTKVVEPAPRGQIYDSKGVPLVKNKAEQAIKFTRSNQLTAEDLKILSQNLVDIIPNALENDNLTDRDKRDFYLATPDNLKRIEKSVPENEKVDENGDRLPEGKLYSLYVDKVSESDLNFSPSDQAAAKVFKKMNATPNFNTATLISGDITDEQVAKIAENERTLAGIKVGTVWEREYPNTALRSILGTISSEKSGIPAEEVDEYLKKGYSRNDRVGTSYLEKGYEEYLQGEKSESQIYVDRSGNVVGRENITDGKRGQDLKLTVDLKFQEGVEKILEDYFNQAKAQGAASLSEGAYAVVMNPDNGSVLAMAGINQDISSGQLSKSPLTTFTGAFVPGSVVKAATITAGWQYGVIDGNQTLVDQPILFQGGPAKSSWFTNGGSLPITAVQALEYSSNTYMLQIVLKMMGQPYSPNMALSSENKDKVFKELRDTFAEYGMGVKTGFDVPGEIEGIINPADAKSSTVGALLDLSFGQYDTYTALQLAQYASTVANGGTRYSPHIVEGIYENDKDDKIGKLVKKVEGEELNKVKISPEQMQILQEGFYEVVHSGSAYATGRQINEGADVSISAKTGTAETFTKDASGKVVSTTANNIVAYAPSNNPKIAISVMIPNLTDDQTHVNHFMARDIVNLYNKMYGLD